MDSFWPWFALAAAGALHGMNPAAGWAFGASAERSLPRLLVPIAAGHVASLGIVAAAMPATLMLGVSFDPLVLQVLAGAGLLGIVARHFRRRATREFPSYGCMGLGLWSFIVGTAHGAGWMLVPALAQVCVSGMPGNGLTAPGSLAVALAAVGVHMVAMLATTAAMATGARHASDAVRRILKSRQNQLEEQP